MENNHEIRDQELKEVNGGTLNTWTTYYAANIEPRNNEILVRANYDLIDIKIGYRDEMGQDHYLAERATLAANKTWYAPVAADNTKKFFLDCVVAMNGVIGHIEIKY